MRKTVRMGECGVDSGQILLIDPCYVLQGDGPEGSFPGTGDYNAVCETSLNPKAGGEVLGGVVVSTAYGDGVYPVTAEVEEDSNGNRRIMRVTIDFS